MDRKRLLRRYLRFSEAHPRNNRYVSNHQLPAPIFPLSRPELVYLYANEALQLDGNAHDGEKLRRQALYKIQPRKRVVDIVNRLQTRAVECKTTRRYEEAIVMLSAAIHLSRSPGLLILRPQFHATLNRLGSRIL